MEVKVTESSKPDGATIRERSSRTSTQRALSSLSADKVNASRSDAVTVTSETKDHSAAQSRTKLNTVISSLNLVADATDEISKLVESVAGITEQAASDGISENRVGALEAEAKQLVNEIQKRTEIEVPEGTKPLSGDPIRVEVERVLDDTLEVILPEVGKDAFGLSTISLSPKENIIRTRVSVEEARVRLDQLREAVQENQGRVGKILGRLDVAAQNSEAAGSTVRDLDEALNLGNSIRRAIDSDPEAALQVSKLKDSSADLLQND
ncbi:MAG: hypothetical protein KDD64_08945 [Bdellovibrionales bacterium]|nr:hypothetical protein [Bdellovibrionales bacterium]